MKRILISCIKGYRLLLSPWLGNSCRFEPTCSAHAMQALERHGAATGSYLMVARLARCQPWCQGGCDPVPEQPPRLFTRLTGARAAGTAPSSIRGDSPTSPSSRP